MSFLYWLEQAEYKQSIFPCWNPVPRGSSQKFHACKAQYVMSFGCQGEIYPEFSVARKKKDASSSPWLGMELI